MFDLQVRQCRTYKFDNVELKFDLVELISSTFHGGAKTPFKTPAKPQPKPYKTKAPATPQPKPYNQNPNLTPAKT